MCRDEAVTPISVPCPVCGEPIEFAMVEKVEWSFPESKIPRVVLTLRSYQGLGYEATGYHWGGECGRSFSVDPDDSDSARELQALHQFVESRDYGGPDWQSAYIDGDDRPVITVADLKSFLGIES